MTFSEIRGRLADAGIEDADFEAYILIEKFEGKSKAAVLCEKGADYTSDALNAALGKRCSRYPLQYIIGEWEFYGLNFHIDENCLIPRPDTEVIVDRALREAKPGANVLDLCTGSGCMIASFLYTRPDARGTAVELFPKTADIAARNIESLGLSDRCRIIVGDATRDIFPAWEKFDIIMSNPPYISEDEMNRLEPELGFEPREALFDGETGGDGMSIIKKITNIYKNHLTPDGALIFEHGFAQGEKMRETAEKNGMSYECITDYGKKVRGAVLKYPTHS